MYRASGKLGKSHWTACPGRVIAARVSQASAESADMGGLRASASLDLHSRVESRGRRRPPVGTDTFSWSPMMEKG